MSEGPFRMPRPADRDAHDHSDANNQSEESKKVIEEHKPVQRNLGSHHANDKSKKRLVAALISLAVLVLAVVGGWTLWSNMNGNGIDGGKYQAVFFTNGQVYFGKLHSFNNGYLKLTNIYYLQATSANNDDQKLQKASDSSSNNVQLIKLGQEIHGPQDEMIISKDQVLFYENLKSDSKVSQAIAKYKP
jgi:hypothetical protein